MPLPHFRSRRAAIVVAGKSRRGFELRRSPDGAPSCHERASTASGAPSRRRSQRLLQAVEGGAICRSRLAADPPTWPAPPSTRRQRSRRAQLGLAPDQGGQTLLGLGREKRARARPRDEIGALIGAEPFEGLVAEIDQANAMPRSGAVCSATHHDPGSARRGAAPQDWAPCHNIVLRRAGKIAQNHPARRDADAGLEPVGPRMLRPRSASITASAARTARSASSAWAGDSQNRRGAGRRTSAPLSRRTRRPGRG